MFEKWLRSVLATSCTNFFAEASSTAESQQGTDSHDSSRSETLRTVSELGFNSLIIAMSRASDGSLDFLRSSAETSSFFSRTMCRGKRVLGGALRRIIYA